MSDINQIIDNLGRNFEAYKSLNDDRMAALEKGKSDPLVDEQLAKLEASLVDLEAEKDRLDEIEAMVGRMNLGGSEGEKNLKIDAHNKTFDMYTRIGANESDLKTAQFEARLSTSIDEQGGFFIPTEMDNHIDRILEQSGVLRKLARIQKVGSATFTKLVNLGGTNAGWVGEQTERKETDTPDLTKLEFPVGELYAEPWATQRDLDDSQIDIQSFISEEVGIAFAKKEAGAFITGNETVKPRGILSYDTVDNDNYAWGKLGFFTSGGAAGFADSNPADQLIDLVESLENGYQGNATLLMNRFTSAAMRKFKNSNGDYIWQQSLTAGVPSEFLGKPIEIDDFMPNIAAGSFPIAYGDFRQGYLITERMGTRMIRDEITKKSMVKFYNRRLVGGGVQNFQAIKLFKIAA